MSRRSCASWCSARGEALMRRVVCGLTGAVAGGSAAALVWLPLLALLALASGGADAIWRPGRAGAVLAAVVPCLGLLQGGVTAAARGRLGGGVLVEAMLSPFAWVMTAGEGFLGGVVMVASLLPGAS